MSVKIIKSITVLFAFLNFLIAPLNNPINAKENVVISNEKENTEKLYIDTNHYILGPGDKLYLDIYELKEYSGPISIINDGTASFPIIGNLNIEGLTINQAIQKIETQLSNELIVPEIQLRLIETRPIQVVLIGQFQRPGLYKLSSNISMTQSEGIGLPTLIDVIKQSGGITKDADIQNVSLQRKLPNKNNEYKFTTLNLYDLIFKGKFYNNPYLHDGDIITLNKTKNTISEEFNIATSNLTSEFIFVNVIGEVNSPGEIKLRKKSSIIDAILKSGGPITWRSSMTNVRLVRLNSNGEITSKKFKINKNYKNKVGSIQLKDGDTIILGSTKLANITDGITTISKPITGLLQIYTLIDLIDNN